MRLKTLAVFSIAKQILVHRNCPDIQFSHLSGREYRHIRDQRVSPSTLLAERSDRGCCVIWDRAGAWPPLPRTEWKVAGSFLFYALGGDPSTILFSWGFFGKFLLTKLE